MSTKTELKSSTAAPKPPRLRDSDDAGPGKNKPQTYGRPQLSQGPPVPFAAFSIPAFCRAHGGFSVSFFHKLMRLGKGPKVMKLGMRTLISAEAAADWRRQREADADGKLITAEVEENSGSPTAA